MKSLASVLIAESNEGFDSRGFLSSYCFQSSQDLFSGAKFQGSLGKTSVPMNRT